MRRKPGPVPRGERVTLLSRPPADQHAVYHDAAEALGIPISSYVAMRMAELHGLEIPDFVHEDLRRAKARRLIEQSQEELPLAQSA